MRVDTQSHLLPPWFVDYLSRRNRSPRLVRGLGGSTIEIGKWRRRVNPKASDVSAKLHDMNSSGIDVSLISPEQPGPELFGKQGIGIARQLNDYIAELCRQHPERFVGLAVLPLQDVPASLVELRRCLSILDFRGLLLFSNIAGKPLDDPSFEPLWAELAMYGTPVYLHPAYPLIADATADYDMIPGFGFMVDTALAAIRIIMSGIMERYPALRIVLPHTGGVLPYLIGRIDDQVGRLARGGERLTKLPSAYLKMMWTDTVSMSPLNIDFALKLWGPEKMLFASDHAFSAIQPFVDLVEHAGLPEVDRRKVFGENAQSLFRIGTGRES